MSATLKDIAAALDLSVNTVSHALRDKPDISAETTRLVKDTAERLGYRKNQAARCLKTNKSMTLGIIVTDISNPIFASFYKSIEKICIENGYILMLGNSNEDQISERQIINNMLEYGVDGLFLIPCMVDSSVVNDLERSGVPCICLQRKFSSASLLSVQSNDFEGGYLAAQFLYRRGYRKFLYVSAQFHISSACDRYNGFLTFLRENGLSEDNTDILTCNATKDGSYSAMKEYIARLPNRQLLRDTAVFCFSDYVAYGVYAALADFSFRIPEDVAVIGYDNIEFSGTIQPGLTTVDLQPQEVGAAAARLMMELLSGKRPMKLPTERPSDHPLNFSVFSHPSLPSNSPSCSPAPLSSDHPLTSPSNVPLNSLSDFPVTSPSKLPTSLPADLSETAIHPRLVIRTSTK